MRDRIRREIEADPYYKQNFSNDGQRFVAWYLRRVLLRDDIATRDDITDGTYRSSAARGFASKWHGQSRGPSARGCRRS